MSALDIHARVWRAWISQARDEGGDAAGVALDAARFFAVCGRYFRSAAVLTPDHECSCRLVREMIEVGDEITLPVSVQMEYEGERYSDYSWIFFEEYRRLEKEKVYK